MSLKQNISSFWRWKFNYLIFLIPGVLLLGSLVDNIPLFRLNTEANLSDVIGVISLILAVVVGPFIINKRIMRQERTGIELSRELDEVNISIKALANLFYGIHTGDKEIREEDWKVVNHTCRDIKIGLQDLEVKMSSLIPGGFELEAAKHFSEVTYIAFTGYTKPDSKIEEEVYLRAKESMDSLLRITKRYKYIMLGNKI